MVFEKISRALKSLFIKKPKVQYIYEIPYQENFSREQIHEFLMRVNEDIIKEDIEKIRRAAENGDFNKRLRALREE